MTMTGTFTKKRTSSTDEDDCSIDDEIDIAESSFLQCPRAVTVSAILYAVTFFVSMVVMELILEGTQNAFADFLGLPYAVTLFQFIVCWALPVATTRGKALEKFPRSTRDLSPYLFLSLIAFGSTCFKSLSVRWVSFPTKVIFKSTKLIPTMMISTLLQNGQQYGQRDYMAALLLCAGAAGYSYSEHKNNDDKQDSYLGLLVLAISVLCDAFTPNVQQRFMAPPAQPSPPPAPAVVATGRHNSSSNSSTDTSRCLDMVSMIMPHGGLGLSASVLMCNTNAVGCVGTLIFMFVSGHIHDAIGVAVIRPHLFGNLVLTGFFLAVAVLAHIRLIKESGAVVAVAVATLREIATVVLSYIVYPKVFSALHAVSAILVLGGILLTLTCSSDAGEHENTSTSRRVPRQTTFDGEGIQIELGGTTS